MTMNELAKHIIAVDNSNGVVITNLKLQKVMYFLLRKMINEGSIEKAKKIYDLPFLVWRYGPVVQSIYERYRGFGSAPIVGNFKENEELRDYNADILAFSRQNVFDLVSESHENYFWKRNESKINGWRSDVAYSLQDIGERN